MEKIQKNPLQKKSETITLDSKNYDIVLKNSFAIGVLTGSLITVAGFFIGFLIFLL